MSLRSGIILLALGLLFLAGGVMAFSHVMGPKGFNLGALVLGLMCSAIGLGILFVFWLLLPPSGNHPASAYEYPLDRLTYITLASDNHFKLVEVPRPKSFDWTHGMKPIVEEPEE